MSVLSVVDMRKRFGEVQALDGCSLSVARGRMLGFLGPNGAGKTTVMRTVSDRADDSAHIDFPRFVAEVASTLARAIVREALQDR